MGAAPKQSSVVVLEARPACLPGVVSLVLVLVLGRHGRPLGYNDVTGSRSDPSGTDKRVAIGVLGGGGC
jgi:hypothetical protein